MIQDRSQNPDQMNFLHADLLDQLNPKHPLLRLARHIPWDYFETEFTPLYSDQGRPAKPIRLMVGLSILKHLENLSDEILIDRWVRDPYQQVFCGEAAFQWAFPCDPSDMTYFRKRIGAAGFEKILSVSVALHGESAIEEEMCVDTTVQERCISVSKTDTKKIPPFQRMPNSTARFTVTCSRWPGQKAFNYRAHMKKKSNNSSCTHVSLVILKTAKRRGAPSNGSTLFRADYCEKYSVK